MVRSIIISALYIIMRVNIPSVHAGRVKMQDMSLSTSYAQVKDVPIVHLSVNLGIFWSVHNQ